MDRWMDGWSALQRSSRYNSTIVSHHVSESWPTIPSQRLVGWWWKLSCEIVHIYISSHGMDGLLSKETAHAIQLLYLAISSESSPPSLPCKRDFLLDISIFPWDRWSALHEKQLILLNYCVSPHPWMLSNHPIQETYLAQKVGTNAISFGLALQRYSKLS